MAIAKPSRSEPVEEDAAASASARVFFDAAAPKRAPKPARSEPADGSEDWSYNGEIPQEALRFQQLATRSERLTTYGGVVSTDDHLETEYYKELASVGSLHYTTGAGFIKMEQNGCQSLALDNGTTVVSCKTRTNPATNDDWEPSLPQAISQECPKSTKPNRSDA